MRYLLDTDICIYLLKHANPALAARVQAHPADALGISAITLAELWHGVGGGTQPARSAERLRTFISLIRPAAFDETAAQVTGHVFADLQRSGKPIGPKDTFIAGHALALGATLVTHNVREFQRVKGLRLVDWTV